MIPKLIIQTGPPKTPLLLEAAMQNLKLLHPDYEYRFFTDAMIEELISTEFPDFYKDYRSFRFRIQKYDFFRYLAVYHLGGFYFDQDVFLARELTPLLGANCVFSFEELADCQYFWNQFGMDWQIGNYAFAAAPGHPFLAAIIENCLRAKRNPDWVKPMMKGIPGLVHDPYYILNTTGPGLVSRTLAENPQLAGDVTVLFPNDVCDRESWHQFGDYGVHHMAGSWRDSSSLLKRRLIRFWEQRNLRRILDQGRQRGKTRSHAGSPLREPSV